MEIMLRKVYINIVKRIIKDFLLLMLFQFPFPVTPEFSMMHSLYLYDRQPI